MMIEIFNYFTRNSSVLPSEVYGNLPFFIDKDNQKIIIYIGNKEKEINYWSYEINSRGVTIWKNASPY